MACILRILWQIRDRSSPILQTLPRIHYDTKESDSLCKVGQTEDEDFDELPKSSSFFIPRLIGLMKYNLRTLHLNHLAARTFDFQDSSPGFMSLLLLEIFKTWRLSSLNHYKMKRELQNCFQRGKLANWSRSSQTTIWDQQKRLFWVSSNRQQSVS